MDNKIKPYLKLILAAVCLGVAGGLVGALFAHLVTLATTLRGSYAFLLFLLPLGGLITVWLYKRLNVSGVGTTHIFAAVNGDAEISAKLTPAIFVSSVLTHLFGGSAGREGAALQIGGGLSAAFSRIFRLNKKQCTTLTMCGMAAVFSAVFGTPLAAAVFAVEAARKMREMHKTIIPILISALIGFGVSRLCLVESEAFLLARQSFNAMLILKAVVIAGLCGIVCYIFCTALYFAKKIFKVCFKNEYIRIAVGGVLIIAVTFIIGNRDYNGAGTNIIAGIFESETVKYEAFALKILLTALTVGAGYKGGEIVPAFFIGATFGACAAALLGVPAPLGAAIGMTALFCGGTKCPLASLFLSLELFGIGGIFYYIIAVAFGFIFSGDAGLYQKPELKALKKLLVL